MNKVKTVAAIEGKQYWTPGDCARLYPQGEDFFRRLFDDGVVLGFKRPAPSGRGVRRYLNAESVRGYFRGLERAAADERARYVETAKPRPLRMADVMKLPAEKRAALLVK